MSKKLLFNLNKGEIQNYTYVKYNGNIVTATNTLNKLVKNAILKGDTKYRDVDTGEILDSFDGTKNLELVSVKMPVLTTIGKNLFFGEVINNKDINNNTGLVGNGNRTIPVNFIFVKPNTTYTFTRPVPNGDVGIRYYSKSQGFLSSQVFTSYNEEFSATFTTPSDCYFIKFIDEANTLEKGYQIEEGTTATSYEPYKTNILTTSKDFELKGLADVKDTLDCNTGEYVERIKEVVLNGETTSNGSTSTDGYIGDYATHLSKLVDGKNEKLYFQGFVGNFGNSKDYILTNGFAQYKGIFDAVSHSELEEGLYRYKGANHAYMCISASRFTDHTFEGVKRFLNENPQSYLVTNKGATTKTVDLSIVDQDGNSLEKMNSFNDTTHVITSSDTVPPIFEGYIATKESVE